MGYLDEVLNSAEGHSYVLDDVRSDPLRDTVHAVCSKRPCLLSASLPGSASNHAHLVGIAKDLLPMASSSSIVVESPEHALSHAVDADPTTYFESKQGSSSEGVVSSSG